MTGRRKVLILGSGYVGLELAVQLAEAGHAVFALRRTAVPPGILPAGIVPLAGDLTQRGTLDSLPGPFDWVINTVSSSRGGEEEYRQVYLEGTRTLLDWMRPRPPEAFVSTSSTSVYGQVDGSWVDESSEAAPGTATGRLLVETENVLLAAWRSWGFPVRILRVAGIYGPGRGHLFHQFLRGEARLDGDGSRWLNMIHRDDVVSAVRAVLERGRNGEIYNAADLEPVTQRAFLEWLAATTGRRLPPVADPAARGPRKRGVTSKRVACRKLRAETGWMPRYPSFREGYSPELQSMGIVGLEGVSPGEG